MNKANIERLKVSFWKFRQKLKRLILGSPARIKLGTRYVGRNEPTFIIAEVGINHNGSLEIARSLIDAAATAGADSVKFQMRDLEDLYVSTDARGMSENLNTQYSLDLLKKVNLKPEEVFSLIDYTKNKGLFPLCTPFDMKSAERLLEYGMDAYKIGSPDLTNHELLRRLVASDKPLLVSTGMSEESEISAANWLLRKLGAKYILMHCNSTYPAPFQDVQLQLMNRLGTTVYGYSGHERGINVAIAAVARGAKIVEKHITLDREMEGTDHKASLLPDEFRQMVEGIRQVEAALGSARERVMTQGERMNRSNLAKSLVAKREIKKGETIEREMIDVKSPGRGLQPLKINELIGRKAKREFKAGEPFYPRDLIDNVVEPRNYQFKRPWGVPVRFHDFENILKKTNPDLLEFHMSYRDLDTKPEEIINNTYDVGLVVHGVETFANDHILDLASSDEEYRDASTKNIQRCIDHTKELKKFFPNTARPQIVVNVGGFSRHGHLKKEDLDDMYKRVADSLSKLDKGGVEIIIQTMPPYPWLLGGQMFHNLFLDPESIAKFCQEYGYRICFDVSHSYLAANHLGRTLTEYINIVGPYIAHIHMVDGAGVGEEGLQIGEGTIDFKQLGFDLGRVAPQVHFIPEIWQGHENGGEGFWVALERLEKWF